MDRINALARTRTLYGADDYLAIDGAAGKTARMLVSRLAALRFDTVSDLLTDTSLSQVTGAAVEAGGFRYEIAEADATDQHVTTAGGIKLYVDSTGQGLHTAAFGVAGDWDGETGTDDTDALQAFFDALRYPRQNSDGLAYVSGKIRITDTVTAKGLNGGVIIFTGSGNARGLSGVGDLMSAIVWDGAQDGTAVVLDGTERTVFVNFSIYSKNLDEDDCAVLVKNVPATVGIPTGAVVFHSFWGAGADTVFQWGTSENSTNTSDYVFSGITIVHNADKGFYCVTQQGFNYTFEYLLAGRVNHAICLERGGVLNIEMLATSFANHLVTLLRGGPRCGVVNINLASLERAPAEFNGFSTDAPVLVNVPDSGGTYTSDFVVNVGPYSTEPRDWTGVHNILSNGVTVNFFGAKMRPNFATITSHASITRKTSARFYGCLLSENSPQVEDYVTCDEASDYVFLNCKDLLGRTVSTDYASGIFSYQMTLADDETWVDFFEIAFAGSASMGIMLEMNANTFLQSVGMRSVARTCGLVRSSGTLSVVDIQDLICLPAAATKIELQAAVDDGKFVVQARRVGGSSSTAIIRIQIPAHQHPAGLVSVTKLLPA